MQHNPDCSKGPHCVCDPPDDPNDVTAIALPLADFGVLLARYEAEAVA